MGKVLYVYFGGKAGDGEVRNPLAAVVSSSTASSLTVRGGNFVAPLGSSDPPTEQERLVRWVLGGRWLSTPEDLSDWIEVSVIPGTMEQQTRIPLTAERGEIVRTRTHNEWGYAGWSPTLAVR